MKDDRPEIEWRTALEAYVEFRTQKLTKELIKKTEKLESLRVIAEKRGDK
jgi:hypothetical protein